MGTMFVDRDSLSGPSQDAVGSLVGLLQGPPDGIHAHEDVGAGVEVLVDEGLLRGRARLHRLEAPHGTFEAGGEVLDAAGGSVRCGRQKFAWEPEVGAVH